MPIRPDQRWLYPIDWKELSATIRFGRAGARCERCARPHRHRIAHLGDGRWWDAEAQAWRSDRGRTVTIAEPFALAAVRTTYVVLACAHLDHDPGNNAPANLAALCQRCHMLHDAAEHRWQRWWNAYRLRGLRDLYEDPRLTRRRAADREAVVIETGAMRTGRRRTPSSAISTYRSQRRLPDMSTYRPVGAASLI